jgi:hypothetical protein
MSADEGTNKDNNLGQSSLESILQEKEKSELTRRERNWSRASYNNDKRRNSKSQPFIIIIKL